MAVTIDDEMIEYVGILAKLSLSGEEREAAKKDMGRMLTYIVGADAGECAAEEGLPV